MSRSSLTCTRGCARLAQPVLGLAPRARSPRSRAPRGSSRAAPRAPRAARRPARASLRAARARSRRPTSRTSQPRAAISSRSRSASAKSFAARASLPRLRELDDFGRRLRRRLASEPSPKISSPARRSAASPRLRQSWKSASASGVLKSSSSTAARRSCSSGSPTAGVSTKKFRNASTCAFACASVVVREVDRLAPVRRHEEEQRDLSPPRVEHVADRDVVAERLRHLLAAELEHAVVHPDPARSRGRARATARARSRGAGRRGRARRRGSRRPARTRPRAIAEHSMCQPGPPAPPRRVPRGVLAGLRRLPEREVARILLERVPLLLLHLVGPLARQPAVFRIARDAEVDVAARRHTRSPRSTSSSMKRTIPAMCSVAFGSSSGRPSPRSPMSSMYHCGRARGELGARARRGVVDLVVHVGDVVDERRVVAAAPQPVAQPHADDERPRVADVRALVDRRPAEVHAHRRRAAAAAPRAAATACCRAASA